MAQPTSLPTRPAAITVTSDSCFTLEKSKFPPASAADPISAFQNTTSLPSSVILPLQQLGLKGKARPIEGHDFEPELPSWARPAISPPPLLASDPPSELYSAQMHEVIEPGSGNALRLEIVKPDIADSPALPPASKATAAPATAPPSPSHLHKLQEENAQLRSSNLGLAYEVATVRVAKRLLEQDIQAERNVRRRLADKLVIQEEQTRMHEEKARLHEEKARLQEEKVRLQVEYAQTARRLIQEERARQEKPEFRSKKQT